MFHGVDIIAGFQNGCIFFIKSIDTNTLKLNFALWPFDSVV